MLWGTRKNPKGPRHWDTYQVDLSGTKLSIESPVHHHPNIKALTPIQGSVNLYDPSRFKRREKADKSQPPSVGLLLKWWRFTALPLINGTGVLADAYFNLSIDHFPEFSSLFHPRHFECAIERMIYASPEGFRVPGESRLDWHVHEINGTQWVSYRCNFDEKYLPGEEGMYQILWHVPISDEHMLTARFDMTVRKDRTRIAELFNALIEKTMSSAEIQLSEDALQSRQAVQAANPDVKIAKTLASYEFEWVRNLNENQMFSKVNKENWESMGYEEMEIETQKRLKAQARYKKESQERELANHLRFKEKM